MVNRSDSERLRGFDVVSSPQNQLRDEDLYRGRLPSSGSTARRKLTIQKEMFEASAIKPTDQDPSKARKPSMMPRRSSVTNLFIVIIFQFCIFLVQIFQNELLEHGVVVFL